MSPFLSGTGHFASICRRNATFSQTISKTVTSMSVSWMLARKSHVYSEQDSDTATTVASNKLGSVLPELSQ